MSSSEWRTADLEDVDRMQENLIAYFRLFAGLPDVNFVEEDMTWIVSKGYPGNLVLKTKLPEDAVEQRLDEALTQIGQGCSAIDWFVFPGCQPNDLGNRLVNKGTAGGPDGTWSLYGKIGGAGGTWMWADLTSLSNSLSVPDNFHTKWVNDLTLLKEWKEINAEGFGGGDYQIFYDAFARHGFGSEAIALHYIGYLDDNPVTSATLLLAGGIASVFNVSTPSSLRRQGLGSAITYVALQEAQKRSYNDAYVWSSPLGRGVYGGIGFVTVDIGMREYQLKKR